MGSLQIYELGLPKSKKNKPLALKTFRQVDYDSIDDDKPKDKELAYLVMKRDSLGTLNDFLISLNVNLVYLEKIKRE